jgi:hypothetical protein
LFAGAFFAFLFSGFVVHELLVRFWCRDVCASGTEAEEAFTHQHTSLRNWINADVGSLTGLLFAAWTITQSKILALVQFANIPVLWALAIGSASPADGQSGRYPSRQR